MFSSWISSLAICQLVYDINTCNRIEKQNSSYINEGPKTDIHLFRTGLSSTSISIPIKQTVVEDSQEQKIYLKLEKPSLNRGVGIRHFQSP